MNAFLQLTLMQLRIFARNRIVIFFSLLFPILMMVGLGSFAGNGNSITLKAYILDRDQTSASQQFIEALRTQDVVQFTMATDEDRALDSLKQGDGELVIVIPQGYGDALAAAKQSPDQAQAEAANIKLYYDETDQAASGVGLTVLNQMADRFSKDLTDYTPLIVIEPEPVQSFDLQYIDFLVPGIVAMMIMNTNLNGVSGQIASWRERGILRKLQSTPLRASTFISAQITSRLLLNGFQAIMILLVGYLFFGTQVNGSWLLLITFVILGTLTFMSIGFIIAGLAKNPESAGPIAGFLSFPLLFLGGIFFPIDNMPDALQPMIRLLPIAHLSTALREVMNVGAGLLDLWVETLLLGVWLIVAFTISVFTFRWE